MRTPYHGQAIYTPIGAGRQPSRSVNFRQPGGSSVVSACSADGAGEPSLSSSMASERARSVFKRVSITLMTLSPQSCMFQDGCRYDEEAETAKRTLEACAGVWVRTDSAAASFGCVYSIISAINHEHTDTNAPFSVHPRTPGSTSRAIFAPPPRLGMIPEFF